MKLSNLTMNRLRLAIFPVLLFFITGVHTIFFPSHIRPMKNLSPYIHIVILTSLFFSSQAYATRASVKNDANVTETKPSHNENGKVSKVPVTSKTQLSEAKTIKEPKSNKPDNNQTVQAVAAVNGKVISAFDFEKLLLEQLSNGALDSVELRKNIRDELIIQTLLSRMAMEEGLDQTREIKMAFEAARRSILSRAWRQNWAQKNPVAENEIQKEYNASITSLGDTEYQIRQVVVADETAAYLILDQLDAGKSLGELAYKYTIESGGKKSKGLLPWVSPSLLLPPLGELVSKAKEGEILPTPVRTKAGWHVVQVEGVRNLKPPSFERLKSQVKQVILQRKMTQEIQQLLNEAEIEF